MTGILILAIYRAAKPDEAIPYYAAILAGYTYEATIAKFVGSV